MKPVLQSMSLSDDRRWPGVARGGQGWPGVARGGQVSWIRHLYCIHESHLGLLHTPSIWHSIYSTRPSIFLGRPFNLLSVDFTL